MDCRGWAACLQLIGWIDDFRKSGGVRLSGPMTKEARIKAREKPAGYCKEQVNLYVAVNTVPGDCLVKVDIICDLTIFISQSFRYSFLVQMNHLCALLLSGLSR